MNNFGASADPKSAVMNQVRQEAAMNDARLLIEVIPLLPHIPIAFPSPSPIILPTLGSLRFSPENKRPLLRTLHPQTRLLPLIRRDPMFYTVHGEVYGGLEYG
jgi:hypothetical protein